MKTRTMCGTILAAVAGWTAWGAPALVPAPRQTKLTGGEHVAKTTWTGEMPIRETVDASLPSEGYRLVVSSGGFVRGALDRSEGA